MTKIGSKLIIGTISLVSGYSVSNVVNSRIIDYSVQAVKTEMIHSGIRASLVDSVDTWVGKGSLLEPPFKAAERLATWNKLMTIAKESRNTQKSALFQDEFFNTP